MGWALGLGRRIRGSFSGTETATTDSFHTGYAKRFPEAMGKTQLPEDIKEPLLAAIDDYRFNSLNTPYGSIRTIKESVIGIPARIEAMDRAEENYALVIYYASQREASPSRIEYQRKLPKIQHELAEIYADNAVNAMELQGEDPPKSAFEDRRNYYQTLLEGSLTTYMVNILKTKRLIPEETKLGGLGL